MAVASPKSTYAHSSNATKVTMFALGHERNVPESWAVCCQSSVPKTAARSVSVEVPIVSRGSQDEESENRSAATAFRSSLGQ
jgi:hypothetical protein